MERHKSTADSQKGSVMIVALLVLALMTIIGVSASEMIVQESLITRNVALYNQNIRLVEASLYEGLQQLILKTRNASDPTTQAALTPGSGATDNYINSDVGWENAGTWDQWYDLTQAGRLLTEKNSKVPDFILYSQLMNSRDELKANNLRYAVFGWDIAAGSSMKATSVSRKLGKVIGEYVSEYGIMRMEAGILVKF